MPRNQQLIRRGGAVGALAGGTYLASNQVLQAVVNAIQSVGRKVEQIKPAKQPAHTAQVQNAQAMVPTASDKSVAVIGGRGGFSRARVRRATPVPRNYGLVPDLRVQFEFTKDFIALAANSTGATFLMVPGAVTGYNTLSTLFARFASYMALFTRFHINSVSVEWIPSVSNLQPGAIAWGYDPDQTATTPASIGAVNSLSKAMSCDIKMGGKLELGPRDLQDVGPDTWYRYVNVNHTDLNTQGVLVFYATHPGMAMDDPIGLMHIKADVSFKGYVST